MLKLALIRSFIIIPLMVNLSMLFSQDLEAGLIAHYLFNGNASDSSGNGNDGIVYNAVLTEDRFGNPNAAYDFNGFNAFIQIPSSVSLESPTNEITQLAWIYIYGYSLTGDYFSPIFMKSNNSVNAFQYRMLISPGGLGASFNNWFNSGVSFYAFNAYEWYMITSTLKNDTLKVYVNDGYLGFSVVNGNMINDNRPLEIGRDVPGIIEHYYGKLDDMRLYNRALTPEEINLLYTPGNLGKDVDLKVFLEGPFNGTNMNTEINSLGLLPLSQPYDQEPWNYPGLESVSAIPNSLVIDWVLVEFRIATTAASANSNTTVARKAAFLLNDGSIVDLDGSSKLRFSGSVNNNLFVIIWHRNHIPVLSASALLDTPEAYVYDFTDAEFKAYGGLAAQKQILPGVYAMYGGNADANGQIDMTDIIAYWRTNAGNDGYDSSDFNLDGQSDNRDKNDIWLDSMGIVEQIP